MQKKDCFLFKNFYHLANLLSVQRFLFNLTEKTGIFGMCQSKTAVY